MPSKKDKKIKKLKSTSVDGWIDTPGLSYVADTMVSEAAGMLESDENYEPILIVGPTGTGKSYIVKKILSAAEIPNDKVVKVNCAAFTETLIESELFGHVKNAFTGADKKRDGLVSAKDKSLLILDEIGTLPKHLQAKLLTFLDDGTFRMIGDTINSKSNIKIIGITNSDTKIDLRDDFFYRFYTLEIPGLHERRHDIPFLLSHFAQGVEWTKGDILRLMAYNWPGNIRELKRFASLVSKNSEKISKPGGHRKSVLLWFESYRGRDQWMNSPIQTEGVPDFQSLKEFKELFANNNAILDEIDEFVEVLSSGEKLFDTVLLTQLSVKINDSPADDNNGASLIDCRHEWLDWCNLLSQDPHNENDIFECILNGMITGREAKAFNRFDDDSLNQKYDNLASKLYQILYYNSDRKDYLKRKSNDGFLSALTLVLDKMNPEEYRNNWIEHCLHLGPSQTAQKYKMIKSTVVSAFQRHKKRNE